MGTPGQHLANKRFVHAALYALARSTPDTLMQRLETAYPASDSARDAHAQHPSIARVDLAVESEVHMR